MVDKYHRELMRKNLDFFSRRNLRYVQHRRDIRSDNTHKLSNNIRKTISLLGEGTEVKWETSFFKTRTKEKRRKDSAIF